MGIRINTLIFLFALSSGASVAFAASDLDKRLDEAYDVIDIDTARGNQIFREVLDEALDDSDFELAAECNLMLGWSHDQLSANLGRAVIYYLEAVRFAEYGGYDDAAMDLAWGLMRTGAIFGRFGDYVNAMSYFDRAIQVTKEHDLFSVYCDLLVESAQLHHDIGQPEKALELLASCLEYFEILSSETIARIYNEQGLIYTDLGRLDDALATYSVLKEYAADNKNQLEFDFEELALHNIGDAHLQKGNYEQAIAAYHEALTYKKDNGSSANSIFITLKDLGESFVKTGDLATAELYFDEAEALLAEGVEKPHEYSLYKLRSQLHLMQGEMLAYTAYQDRYGSTLEEYLVEKQRIETEDKRYSLELITKRYLGAMELQERNRRFRQYAQMGGVALVFVIIIILGYYQYSRYRLRRDLEESLRPYAETVYID